MPEPDAAHPDSGSDRPAAGALGLRPDWWLVIASSLEYLAISISTQASNQLWLDRFGGDYAAQAEHTSWCIWSATWLSCSISLLSSAASSASSFLSRVLRRHLVLLSRAA